MKLIKLSSTPENQILKYYNITDKKKLSLFNFIKSQNLKVTLFHGTSSYLYKKILEKGYLISPNIAVTSDSLSGIVEPRDSVSKRSYGIENGYNQVFLWTVQDAAKEYAKNTSMSTYYDAKDKIRSFTSDLREEVDNRLEQYKNDNLSEEQLENLEEEFIGQFKENFSSDNNEDYKTFIKNLQEQKNSVPIILVLEVPIYLIQEIILPILDDTQINKIYNESKTQYKFLNTTKDIDINDRKLLISLIKNFIVTIQSKPHEITIHSILSSRYIKNIVRVN